MINKQKIALVTGASGFIGSHLARKLLSLGYDVHILARKSSNLWRIKDIQSQLIIHDVNLTEKSLLQKTVSDIHPTHIFHLAIYANYRNQDALEEMVDVNIRGTLHLLLATKNLPYEVFVNTGSSSEYGIKNTPMKETDVLMPKSFYAVTKVTTTLLCQEFARAYDKPIITLRPFSVYGPFEEKNRFIPTIILSLLQEKPISLTDGAQRRDFVYIDDVVNAYTQCIYKASAGSGNIFNIGTGIENSNDNVVQELFSTTKTSVPIGKGTYPKRSWDMPHWVADISSAKKILRWSPEITLAKGLQKTYSWFLKNDSLYKDA